MSDEMPREVCVAHAHGELEAQLFKTLLESHDIPCRMVGESLRWTHGLTMNGLAEVKIMVHEADEAVAREVIETAGEAGSDDSDA